MTRILISQIESLAPHMVDQYREAFSSLSANKILTKYAISKSPLRICHFLAQILTETGDLQYLRENLNYSPTQLIKIWPKRFPTVEIAAQCANNEERLGDFVYGGRLGNTEAGDGYLYRGRGLLQITGRDAYNRFGKQLGIELIENPDLAFSSDSCLEIAAAEWAVSGYRGKHCNELADNDDLISVTYAINGGQNGISQRAAWLHRAKAIWFAQPVSISSRAEANTGTASSLTIDSSNASVIAPTLITDEARVGTAPSSTPLGAVATPSAGPRPFDRQMASFCGQFVQAAYSMYSTYCNTPNRLTPPTTPDFPSGYKLAAWIVMQDFILQSTAPTFYGFVAQSNVDVSQFIVAIRGTSNGVEWWDDANAVAKVPFKIAGCGLIGAGFGRIYDTLEVFEHPAPVPSAMPAAAALPRSLRPAGAFSQQIAALVLSRTPAALHSDGFSNTAKVEVTGHSLGAALATLYAIENACTDRIANPTVCTFASPLVGDTTFANAFNALGLTSWRVDNEQDLVTKVPWEFLGFAHVDAKVSVDSTGKVMPFVTCWHALSTYLSLIDPTKQPGPGCLLTSAAQRDARPVG